MGMATLLKKSNSPSTCSHQLGNSSLASGWDLRKPSLLLLTGLIFLRPWAVTIATYEFVCAIAMSRPDHSTLQYSSPFFQILFYFCPSSALCTIKSYLYIYNSYNPKEKLFSFPNRYPLANIY